MLDVRLPIGLMFLAIGLLLAAYGLMTPAALYKASLGYNLNLLWGAAMAAFGGVMFAWMKLDPYDSRPHPKHDTEGWPEPTPPAS